MSFTPVSKPGIPSWSGEVIPSTNFLPVNIALTSILEVGYDEGGYGEDGYDTPSIIYPSAGRPNWTVVANK